MAGHYYSENPESAHARREIRSGDSLEFTTDSGVFSRAHVDPGSLLLIDAARPCEGRVLDLGYGYGPIGITLAREYPEAQFVLSDVNRRAVALCEENIAKNKIANAKALFSDGCAELDGTFDQIVSNPPIRIGKSALQNMWRDCREKLNDGGTFWIVIRKKQGAPSAAAFLTELFGNCETVARKAGYHVLCCKKGESIKTKEGKRT